MWAGHNHSQSLYLHHQRCSKQTRTYTLILYIVLPNISQHFRDVASTSIFQPVDTRRYIAKDLFKHGSTSSVILSCWTSDCWQYCKIFTPGRVGCINTCCNYAAIPPDCRLLPGTTLQSYSVFNMADALLRFMLPLENCYLQYTKSSQHLFRFYDLYYRIS